MQSQLQRSRLIQDASQNKMHPFFNKGFNITWTASKWKQIATSRAKWTCEPFLPFTQENINQDKIHVQCKWNQISFLLWRQLSLRYISKTMVDLISPATGMSSIHGWPIQSWWCNNLVSNVDIPLPPLHTPIFPIPKQRHVAHHWSGTLLALCRPTCHPRPSSCSRMAWTWSGKASYPPVVPHSWGLPDSTPWSDVPSLWLPYR